MENSNQNQHKYHILDAEETLRLLNAEKEGLTREEAERRLQRYGPNKLEEGKKRSIAVMLFEQFKNVMVIILIIAALISGFLNELADTAIIMAIVIINAVLGVVQESKAEKALEALKSMASPKAKVKRNGKVEIVDSDSIVPGDIVLLEAGDYVPADMRLIEAVNLKAEEAALTGESEPVLKTTESLDDENVVIGDRINMAYSGSSISYGRGSGVATSTGMSTEVGNIAGYLSETDTEKTPLQLKLEELAKYLTVAIVFVAAVIFAAGIMQGRSYFDMFLTAVSLAVAAIPEGMPAIVTIVLALGVQKMSKRKAIIRRLPAVETLGSTQIICSDKTGTLTQNKMSVRDILIGEKHIKSGSATGQESGFKDLLHIMSLCNDTRLTVNESGSFITMGDPTETALVDYAFENGIDKNQLESEMERKFEIPFDSDRKLMSTINKTGNSFRVHTKGAPDILLDRCSMILTDEGIKPLSQEYIETINNSYGKMAAGALRVLAFAYKDLESAPSAEDITSHIIENGLIFAGLVGMIDPPREEAFDAVQTCRTAGIRPIMITGDHRDTAAAIARDLEIIHDESEVLTGIELDEIGDEDFVRNVHKYSVYARVSPEHKVRIVKAWKTRGKVVAMTGDGVNDAPALKNSDIGVGMGITGTDVSKGVSDMVLADDNFATIVLAVKEGRRIYSNIRNAIQFLLSANTGEVLTLFLATMMNWRILLPIHILWINLVTDAFPALALGAEKPEPGIMKRKPRDPKSSMFAGGVGTSIIYQGVLEGLITLAAFYIGLKLYSGDVAITMAFVTLGLIQLAHSLNVRSNDKSIFELGLFSNRFLIGAIVLSAFLQVIVVVVPFLREVFKVTSLNLEQWVIVVFASVLIIPAVEFVKLVGRKTSRH